MATTWWTVQRLMDELSRLDPTEKQVDALIKHPECLGSLMTLLQTDHFLVGDLLAQGEAEIANRSQYGDHLLRPSLIQVTKEARAAVSCDGLNLEDLEICDFPEPPAAARKQMTHYSQAVKWSRAEACKLGAAGRGVLWELMNKGVPRRFSRRLSYYFLEEGLKDLSNIGNLGMVDLVLYWGERWNNDPEARWEWSKCNHNLGAFTWVNRQLQCLTNSRFLRVPGAS